MRTKKGIVTSAKMTGTVTVAVHRQRLHHLYKKHYRISTKFLADPGTFELHEGDEVVIAECRPLSARKHFRVIEVTKAAPRLSEVAEEEAIEAAIHRTKPTRPNEPNEPNEPNKHTKPSP